MKIVTVVGARPQFIKAAPVSWAIREGGDEEFLIHTGQHYDYEMSEIFFKELNIPTPDVNLEVGSGSHGKQTADALAGVEEQILARAPDAVLVYGDTNSTLAGAVAACKLGVPLAHVEAGLRSYNRAMPEEHNRVLTDHCADLLFCPTARAVKNLASEGITHGVHRVGDTMFDMLQHVRGTMTHRDGLLEQLNVQPGEFYLATVHRAENTDNPDRLTEILRTLGELDATVVLPMHPRTRARLGAEAGSAGANLRIVDPVGYIDMTFLLSQTRMVLTDSGGVQKEALWAGRPCITMRTETEWIETVETGWNVVTGTDREKILAAVARSDWPTGDPPPVYGTGNAAADIVSVLKQAVT